MISSTLSHRRGYSSNAANWGFKLQVNPLADRDAYWLFLDALTQERFKVERRLRTTACISTFAPSTRTYFEAVLSSRSLLFSIAETRRLVDTRLVRAFNLRLLTSLAECGEAHAIQFRNSFALDFFTLGREMFVVRIP